MGYSGAVVLHCHRDHLFWRDLPFCSHLAGLTGELGDGVVLTVKTAEVTAGSGDGKGETSGKEMEERFLFYGIRIRREDLSIDKRVENATLVFSHPADTPFPLFDEAVMTTEKAANLFSFKLFIEKSFFQIFPPKKVKISELFPTLKRLTYGECELYIPPHPNPLTPPIEGEFLPPLIFLRTSP